jgi:thiamine pyrophosphate-dependent acetolactate synthase large subunit-like protein
VILNSFSLGWPKRGQTDLGGRYIATDFKVQPDFVLMAQAYKCYGERVERPEDLRGALTRALEANKQGQPAIIDVIVDETEVGPGFVAYETAKKVK